MTMSKHTLVITIVIIAAILVVFWASTAAA